MQALNITFHGVGDCPPTRPPEEAPVWVSVQAFEAILDSLEAVQNVAITFDDGNVSDVHIALPALTRRGMRAQFYVCAGLLGREGYLTAADVQQLVAAGMTVGSHGMVHRAWRGLRSAELRQEVVEAKDRLEQLLAMPVTQAACPFGAYDRRSLTGLREAGFRRIYTSDGGSATPDAWLQARNTVHDGDGPETVARWIANVQRRVPLLKRLKLQVKRWR